MYHGAYEGSYLSIQHLLQHGANPSILNDMQEGPLDIAIQRHHSDIVSLFNQMAQHTTANGHMNQAHLKNDPYKRKAKRPAKPKIDINGHDFNGQHQKPRKKRKKREDPVEESHSTLSPPDSLDSPQSVNRTPPPLYAQRMVGQNFEGGMFVPNGHMIPMEYSDNGRHPMRHTGYSDSPGMQHEHSPCREALESESPDMHMNMGQIRWHGNSQPMHCGQGGTRVIFQPDSNSAMPQIIQQAPSQQSLVVSPNNECDNYLSPRTHRSPNRGQAPQQPTFPRQQSPSMQPSTPQCEVPRAQANSPIGGGETQRMNNHIYGGSPMAGQTQLNNMHFQTPPSNQSMAGPISAGNSPMQQQVQHMYPDNILTPSPEAADGWSSSPHKSPHGDWSGSESISSSPGPRGDCPVMDVASLPYHQYPQQKGHYPQQKGIYI